MLSRIADFDQHRAGRAAFFIGSDCAISDQLAVAIDWTQSHLAS
jgi:hypothetical protein